MTATPAAVHVDSGGRPAVGDRVRFRATFVAADPTVFDEAWHIDGFDRVAYSMTGETTRRVVTAPKTAVYRLT